MDWTQFLASAITIITGVAAANFGIVKFLLRDFHKEQATFNKEMEERKKEYTLINNRMDGIYKVLLDKSYPKESK